MTTSKVAGGDTKSSEMLKDVCITDWSRLVVTVSMTDVRFGGALNVGSEFQTGALSAHWHSLQLRAVSAQKAREPCSVDVVMYVSLPPSSSQCQGSNLAMTCAKCSFTSRWLFSRRHCPALSQVSRGTVHRRLPHAVQWHTTEAHFICRGVLADALKKARNSSNNWRL